MPNWSYGSMTFKTSKPNLKKLLESSTTHTKEDDVDHFEVNPKKMLGIGEVLNGDLTNKKTFPLQIMGEKTDDHISNNRIMVTTEAPQQTIKNTEEWVKSLGFDPYKEINQEELQQFVDVLQDRYKCNPLDWYGINIKHLGTKWEFFLKNLTILDIEDDLMKVTFSFETAWSPPREYGKYIAQTVGNEVELEYELESEGNYIEDPEGHTTAKDEFGDDWSDHASSPDAKVRWVDTTFKETITPQQQEVKPPQR